MSFLPSAKHSSEQTASGRAARPDLRRGASGSNLTVSSPPKDGRPRTDCPLNRPFLPKEHCLALTDSGDAARAAEHPWAQRSS